MRDQPIAEHVDSAQKEARHRAHTANRLAFGAAPLQSSRVGACKLQIALDREKQRDVDVQPQVKQLLHGRDPGARARDLDHQVRTVDALPQPARLDDGADGIVSQVGGDLQADEAIFAVARVEGRAQNIAGALDIGHHQIFVNLFRREPRGSRRVDLFVVSARGHDRVVERPGVGRDAAKALVTDTTRQVPASERVAAEIVEPIALPVLEQLLERVHVGPFARAGGRCALGRRCKARAPAHGVAPAVDGSRRGC
jgi:hypothetical protein